MSEIKFSKTDFIGVYNDVLQEEDCKRAIDYIDLLDERCFLCGEGRREGQPSGNHLINHKTLNLVHHYDLPSWNWISTNVQPVIATCVNHYLNEFSVLNRNQFAFPDLKVKKICAGGGFHNWHHEDCGMHNAIRYLVVQIFLNDNFEGGETEFLYINKRIEAKAGRLIIYPAGFTHTHRGNPPIGGTKYLIGTWGLIQARTEWQDELAKST